MFEFKKYDPPWYLRNYIAYYFRLIESSNGRMIKHLSLPDTSFTIIFNFSQKYNRLNPFLPHLRGEVSHSAFAGLMTRIAELVQPGNSDVFCVKLKPSCLHLLTRTPVSNFTDMTLELMDVFGPCGRILEDQVLNSKDDLERVKIMNRFIHDRILRSTNIDKTVVDLINEIKDNKDISMAEIEQKSGLSLRTIENRFKAVVGINPKNFSRIVRFNRFLSLLNRSNNVRMIELLYDCNYYDQAHLIKDFRSITSFAPKKIINLIEGYAKETVELMPLTR